VMNPSTQISFQLFSLVFLQNIEEKLGISPQSEESSVSHNLKRVL
jgi:hypothetical protein